LPLGDVKPIRPVKASGSVVGDALLPVSIASDELLSDERPSVVVTRVSEPDVDAGAAVCPAQEDNSVEANASVRRPARSVMAGTIPPGLSGQGPCVIMFVVHRSLIGASLVS
jgi:hypothetical protein